ncbi:putative DNA-binding transcriptional regulator YafY [Stackebrandtia albiflava]|uniref:Putative DNA-binding transcriptional regulator YafY n=1 Tax=Stackebrandtia albiflava TaxID=406432 RepID=A0A562V526_9ACTN|nr:WYL domain-containing protein [Stackebrandtia albiflava]TWJ12955.1 putative DNA-binding transcriptional regulator YafY [Stackebrandtia albiflava]
MSSSTPRILALLELLQSRPGATGPQLAESLGVDQRTLRRYMRQLDDLGITVQATRGRRGGYRLRPGFKLPPLLFTGPEAVALSVALLAARRIGVSAGDGASATAEAKLRRVVPADVAELTAQLGDALDFTLPETAATAPPVEVLTVFGEAVARHRRVHFGYRTHDGATGEREFEPYRLVFHSGRWYVVGRDVTRAALRNLRVDRVAGPRLTDVSFTPPEGFDPAAHLLGSLAAVPYRHDVEVLLDLDAAAARDRIPRWAGTVVSTGAGTVLRARAEDLSGMARILAGLGCRFTVRRPAGLRDEVRALAGRLMESADGVT